MISVLMSAYNEPIEYIRKAVDSILNQTYKNIEFIIVVDSPQNQTLINYFKYVEILDNRVKILINEKNLGLALSLNKALSAAEGEIVARMDADDISERDRLEKELAYLTDNRLDVIGCAVDIIDEDENVWGKIPSYSSHPEDYAMLLPVQNVLVHPSTMMKTDTIRVVDGYRNFSSCQDYDLWLRLLSKGYKFGVCPDTLLQYRNHRKSITATCRYGQYLNESYIRKLFSERKSTYGEDSFSEERLKEYLTQNGFYDKKQSERQNNLLIQYSHGISEIKKQNYISGIVDVIGSLKSAAVRESVLISIKSKKIRKSCVGK